MRTPVLAAALAAILAACAGTADPGGPPVDEARVGLVEWDITASATRLADGPVSFDVTNAGTTAHDLRIEADGRQLAATPLLDPGQGATLTVDLVDAERVLLICAVPGHRKQGMRRQLPVGP
ncbi:MAG: hypothetical protein ACR2KP_02435 [Egibacteraceae bacterium]